MATGRSIVRVGVAVMSIGVLILGTGCGAKRVSSTGDQSTIMKGKSDTGGVVENVQAEPFASVETTLPTGGSTGKEPRGALASPSAPGSMSIPGSSVMPDNRRPASGAPDMTGLGDIYFDFDRYSIRTDALPVLEGDARWLRSEQGKSLLIEGHCDERGTLAYNLVLGEKRAKSAKRYLEELGIPGSRIHTTSYGEVRPLCQDHNEGCWSKNRRDHFVVQ